MPALVNSSVGSSPGTTGELATIWWPFDSKNFRKVERISEAFIGWRVPGLFSRMTSGHDLEAGPARDIGQRRVERRQRAAPLQRQLDVGGVVGRQTVGRGGGVMLADAAVVRHDRLESQPLDARAHAGDLGLADAPSAEIG